MSDEIVVGACYRDLRDGEIVRVVGPEQDLLGFPAVVLKAGKCAGYCAQVGARVWRDREALAERVPDPTPAAIDDGERPLAGEMTLRQVEAWRTRRGIDDLSLLYATRTGLWHAYAERDGTVIGHGSSSDPQDAITALMARVGP